MGTLTARLGLIKVKNMRLTFDPDFYGSGGIEHKTPTPIFLEQMSLLCY